MYYSSSIDNTKYKDDYLYQEQYRLQFYVRLFTLILRKKHFALMFFALLSIIYFRYLRQSRENDELHYLKQLNQFKIKQLINIQEYHLLRKAGSNLCTDFIVLAYVRLYFLISSRASIKDRTSFLFHHPHITQ